MATVNKRLKPKREKTKKGEDEKEKGKNGDDHESRPFLSQLLTNFENETGHKSEIKQLFKDVEDESKTDEYIQEKFNSLLITFHNTEIFATLHNAMFSGDELSFLHLAAKNCRYSLCVYLIKKLNIETNILSKSMLTPLHILARSDLKIKKLIGSGDKNALKADQEKKFALTFKVLIEHGANCNAQDENGYTPLHHAVIRNNYIAVQLLVQTKDIQINAEDKKHWTPLHLACRDGFEKIAFLLTDMTSVEELVASSGDSLPVHLACRNKNEQHAIVRRIMNKIKAASTPDRDHLGATLKKLDAYGQNLLHIAIENNHAKIVDSLFQEYGADKEQEEEKTGNLPIHVAAKNSSVDAFRVLQKHQAVSFKNNHNEENALHLAAANLNGYKFISEFLAYEKKSRESEAASPSGKDSNTVPLINALNTNHYTPLFIAISADNLKCVQELLKADNIEIDAKDADENTMYHVCAEFNNVECLRHLLTKKDPKFFEPLLQKNANEDTVINVACNHGNIEIVKLVISKISDGFSSTEAFVMLKNKEGNNGFHIACMKGFYNIAEYFLKDLKLVNLLETKNNQGNTALLLAAVKGNLSIVSLLINNGADLYLRNEDNNTALELSCRNGYFEISKILISHYSKNISQSEKSKDHPLHVACHEGAHEVVKLLLIKGAPIDILNEENKNCLDIALNRGHREVIKILLTDENWDKLIETNADEDTDDSDDPSKPKVRKQTTADALAIIRPQSVKMGQKKKENPQMYEMFDKKMWDMIKITLDNCKKSPTHFDFRKLDPPCKNFHRHPLFMMARSGQETLLKHEATQLLLKLKWRYIPRIVFYSNILFYILFLILFSFYGIELTNREHASVNKTANSSVSSLDSDNETMYTDSDRQQTDVVSYLRRFTTNSPRIERRPANFYENLKHESNFALPLVIIILFHLIKVLCSIAFLDRLAYFASLQNLMEAFTYVTSLISCLSNDMLVKSGTASLSILSSFIVLSFLIQKMQVFGLYVLAFRRTLMNSAKFFPIFLLIYVGFMLSFRIRSNYSVSYFSSTGSLIIKTLTMVVGDLDSDRMGLEDPTSIPNYILYCLFISIMCVIILNLFVGIAVGEIKTVLDEADIQQTSMRIMFVLNVESSLSKIRNRVFFCKKVLNMRYKSYSYDNENRFVKSRDKLLIFLKRSFKSKEPSIKLVDPQKRLEDSLVELSRSTGEELKSIRETFGNQLTDVEIKLSNSQQRLEDQLLEMGRKTITNFELNKEDSSNQMNFVENRFLNTQLSIQESLRSLNAVATERMMALRQSFGSKLKQVEDRFKIPQLRLQGSLNELANETTNQFRAVKEDVGQVSQNVSAIQNELVRVNQEMVQIKNENTAFRDFLSKYSSQIEAIAKLVDESNKSITEYRSDVKSLRTATENMLETKVNEIKEEMRSMRRLEPRASVSDVTLLQSAPLRTSEESIPELKSPSQLSSGLIDAKTPPSDATEAKPELTEAKESDDQESQKTRDEKDLEKQVQEKLEETLQLVEQLGSKEPESGSSDEKTDDKRD